MNNKLFFSQKNRLITTTDIDYNKVQTEKVFIYENKLSHMTIILGKLDDKYLFKR